MADPPRVSTLAEAQRWLDRLEQSGRVQATGAWPISAILDHLAQSIEMSMDGYPQPRGPWFQQTVGSAAFAYFRWRGRMSHSLVEPIPGAPPLATGAQWKVPGVRLRRAIERFEAHRAALKPHFAYGSLTKSDYALAHALHIANHQEEIILS